MIVNGTLKVILAPAISMLVAGVTAYGTVQFALGQQDAKIGSNDKAIGEVKETVKDVQKDVQTTKEGVARIDERTRIILEAIQRQQR